MTNGRMWKDMNRVQKVFYLQGYREGVTQGLTDAVPKGAAPDSDLAKAANAAAERLAGPLTFENGEMSDAIDHFFEDPLNVRIPVLMAIPIVVEQAHGKNPEEINQHIRDWRQVVNRENK